MKKTILIHKTPVFLQYLFSAAIIGGTALICIPLAKTQNYPVVSFILLFVVSLLSAFLGTGPVLLASTLGALAWNYFFIPPHNTFHIEKTEDLLIFALFFIIALVNGVLTTRVRRQEKLARERERHTQALFSLTRELSKVSGIREVIRTASREINSHFTLDPLFLIPEGSHSLCNKGSGQERLLPPGDYSTALWSFENSREAGAFTANPFHSDFTFYPLPGTRLKPGVVAVRQASPFTPEQKTTFDTFVTLASNAIEREFLDETAQKVRFLDESDRLYKTLFNSISHEFRIPVATIMGASDSMLNTPISRSVQTALCQEILTASLRLNRLIENLLNMSRIESGHFSPRPDWHDINDLVNKVAEELREELKPFTLQVTIPDDMPLVKMDFGLMEQVLHNLLLNASQYAPAASAIAILTGYRNGNLVISVSDQGPGFPEEELEQLFDKFYRVKGSHSGGLGLGLSIAKGFVAAHKGTLTAENLPGGGARFTLSIPSEIPDIQNLPSHDR